MKKLTLLLLALAGAFSLNAQVRFAEGSTDDLRRMAEQSGKLVFVDLYATWCGPCRAMDRNVFSKREVGDFMDSYFVAGHYDVDQPTGKALSKTYNVSSIPTYLIFNTDGDLVGRMSGSMPADQFIREMQAIVDRQSKGKQ